MCNRFEKFAVCLESSNDFRAFGLDGVNDAWIGCLIKNVELQADIESRFTEYERSIRPGDLVGVLSEKLPLSARDIGTIDILDNATFVEVPAAAAQDVIKVLRRARLKGKKANVTLARPFEAR